MDETAHATGPSDSLLLAFCARVVCSWALAARLITPMKCKNLLATCFMPCKGLFLVLIFIAETCHLIRKNEKRFKNISTNWTWFDLFLNQTLVHLLDSLSPFYFVNLQPSQTELANKTIIIVSLGQTKKMHLIFIAINVTLCIWFFFN